MANSENNSLVPVNVDYAIMGYNMNDLAEVIRENLGGATIDPTMLDKISIPAAGGTTWTIPTLDGDEETKVLEGILVCFADQKAWWEKSYEETGGGAPPDCYSDDGFEGVGNPGMACDQCPLNKFGSATKGKGKACKDMRNLFIVRKGSILPAVVTLPPTSIKPMKQFMLRLAAQGILYTSCTIKLELEKDKNEGGIIYSKVKPSLGQRLPDEQAAQMKAFAEAIRPALKKIRVIDVVGQEAVSG